MAIAIRLFTLWLDGVIILVPILPYALSLYLTKED